MIKRIPKSKRWEKNREKGSGKIPKSPENGEKGGRCQEKKDRGIESN